MMFCENCGVELQDPNQKFCPNCGIPLRKKIIFRYNDDLNEFKDLEVDNDVRIRELLDPDSILLFVDSKRYRIWIWHGSNTTTRMKFIAAKLAPSIRDQYGTGFKIAAVDEGNETLGFKIAVGLEEEIDYKFIFKVNDLLTLKLEDSKTYIYIKGKKFMQCIRLSLQIPTQSRHLYEEIESIDEAAEVYKQSLWENRIVEGPMAQPSRFQNRSITPEQEFWGHCSNIQAWAEHDYDTRVLHSNLSFPLLKALSDAGDPKAKAKFEEEIAIRFESGYPSVVNYLLEQGYLRYLDKDRLKTLLENYPDIDLNDRFLGGIQGAKKAHMLSMMLALDIVSKFRRLAKTKRTTLLIVGNEPEFLDLLKSGPLGLFGKLELFGLFGKLGKYAIITCSNTKEALRVIEESYHNIAMILVAPMITDHWMDKEKFSQYVKSDERYKHILVGFLRHEIF